MRGQQKSDQPEPVALTIFGWAVRGSACCAGGRCGALRLARCAGKCLRISSAPRPNGFDPMRGQQKSDQPEPVALTIFGWAVRGSACFAGGRYGALRLARYAGKCLRISSAPRPDGFDPMRGQQKSDQPKPVALTCFGGPSGGRTLDLGIKSPLLYQLS